jgi:poly(hydroxyalkanoate) depolymerase family esterase
MPPGIPAGSAPAPRDITPPGPALAEHVGTVGGLVENMLARLGIDAPRAGAGYERPVLAPHADAPEDALAAAPGQYLAGSYTNDAGTRAYKLYVPTAYRGQALPLVVMLHGCSQTPDDFAAGTRFNAVAEEQPCLVLYPGQAQSANVSRCWNWYNAADQQRDRGEPSIIAGMTREIVETWHVDPARVYIAGLSAGGAMALVMATTYPDLYAAVGVHSGVPYAAANDLPSALAAMQGAGIPDADAALHGIPVIVFHGDRDQTVHPRNSDRIVAQSGPRQAAPHVKKGQTGAGHAYTQTVHHGEDGKAAAEHWLVHGAAHAWSGGSRRGSFTDGKGPDASREMMRFFATHAKPAAG